MIECGSFLFKRKTAYEMRSSDWSSDGCSSDLEVVVERHRQRRPDGAGEIVVALGQLLSVDLERWVRDQLLGLGDGLLQRGGGAGDCLTGACRSLGGAHQETLLMIDSANLSKLSTFFLSGSVSGRSEEHTSELQSLMRISYAVFCLKKKKKS